MAVEPGRTGDGEKARPSRFFAVPVTGGSEIKVALVFANRANIMGLDIRSIVVPVDLKGFVIVEAGKVADVYDLMWNVRNVKGKRPRMLKPEEAIRLAKPSVELPKLEKGQIVEIIAGPFRGMRGRVVEVYESRGEVDLVLLESEFQMVVTLPLDQVKPAEES